MSDSTTSPPTAAAGAVAPAPSLSPSADCDSLPAPIRALLAQVSAEARRDGGLVPDEQLKQHIQQRLKQHAAEQAAGDASSDGAIPADGAGGPLNESQSMRLALDSSAASASSSSFPSSSAASSSSATPALPLDDPLDASSDTLPAGPPGSGPSFEPSPLLRQLSEAARVGTISAGLKHELQNLLLSSRSGVLSSTRLVRRVSERGELQTRSQALDLSTLPEGAEERAAEMQAEERQALESIYEDAAKFEVTARTLDADEQQQREEEEEQDEEDEEEAESEEEKDEGEGEEEVKQATDDNNEPSNVQQQCVSVTLLLRPEEVSLDEDSDSSKAASSSSTSAQKRAERDVSALVRFVLPPLYPFVRPSFHIVSLGAALGGADGMMLSTLLSEKVNSLYAREPLSEEDARVCLFDLTEEVLSFLREFLAFLRDREHHARIEAELAAAKQKLEAEQSRARAAAQRVKDEAEYLRKHALEVLEYLRTGHNPALGADGRYNKPVSAAERARREAALRELEEEERLEKERREQQEREMEQIRARRAEEDAQLRLEHAQSGLPASFSSILPEPLAVIQHLHRTDRNFAPFLPGFESGELHLESIVSPFLAYRFMSARARLLRDGDQQRARVDIAFHGTSATSVGSIATHGLVVPGEKVGVEGSVLGHRTDSGFFGRGIYLSPYASYSWGYGGANNTFVCLVLRGWSFECPLDQGRGLEPGFDSHHCLGGGEWVIFDSACVLPIYLIRGHYIPQARSSSSSSSSVATPMSLVASKAKSGAYRTPKVKHKPPLTSKAAQLLKQIQEERDRKAAAVKKGPVSTVKPKSAKLKAQAAAARAKE